MLLGAHLAGGAIENSMLGATHALANPLSAHFNLTHGIAIGVMLPHVIRYNSEVVGPLYGEFAADAGLVRGRRSRAPPTFLARFVASLVAEAECPDQSHRRRRRSVARGSAWPRRRPCNGRRISIRARSIVSQFEELYRRAFDDFEPRVESPMRIPRFVWVALGIVAAGVVLLAARDVCAAFRFRWTRSGFGPPEGAEIGSSSAQFAPTGAHAERKRQAAVALDESASDVAHGGQRDKRLFGYRDSHDALRFPTRSLSLRLRGPRAGRRSAMATGNSALRRPPCPTTRSLSGRLKTSEGMVGCAAVVGGQVYLPCLNGQLLSVDRLTGKQQWSYRSIESTNPNDFAPGFKAAPTVSIDTVYVGDEEGNLHAVDRKNGKLKWKFTTGNEIAGSVALVGENIIFGSHDSFLYCLKASDHSVVWKISD